MVARVACPPFSSASTRSESCLGPMIPAMTPDGQSRTFTFACCRAFSMLWSAGRRRPGSANHAVRSSRVEWHARTDEDERLPAHRRGEQRIGGVHQRVDDARIRRVIRTAIGTRPWCSSSGHPLGSGNRTGGEVRCAVRSRAFMVYPALRMRRRRIDRRTQQLAIGRPVLPAAAGR